MGKENIEKYSVGYAILKFLFGFWHNNVFYRRVIVIGRGNINPQDHIIFAPNHQNALMDALAVLFTMKGQPVFLARADIFKSKFIARILYFLKMLPVYRIRDGFRSVIGNDEIFDKTIDVLRNKNGLIILPEGNHEFHRRLRQLKKGICRIAFTAEEASGFNLNIKIIPVGLEFSHYYRYRQVLTVVYGKPIEVAGFHELYRKSPEVALNELREKLSHEMKQIMVHIESEDDYEAIDELRSLVNGRYSDRVRFPKLFRDRILIDKLNRLKINNPDLYKKICCLSLEVKNKAVELGTDYRLLAKKKHTALWLYSGMVGLIVSLPVFIFGNIFNLILLEVPNLRVRNIKDQAFISTFKYGLSMAMAFVLFPLFLIISFLIFKPWWFAVLVILALPFCGLLAWYLYLVFLRIKGGFRIRKYVKNKNLDFINLKKNYDNLTGLIAAL